MAQFSETRLHQARRFFTTKELPFYVGLYGQKTTSLYFFKSTTYAADGIGQIMQALNGGTNNRDLELVGEGDFMGWDIETIATNLERLGWSDERIDNLIDNKSGGL